MPVRYLHVWEHRGSLALAVLPETLALVQTISLPAIGAAVPHGSALLSLLNQWQAQLDGLQTSAPDTSAIDPVKLRLMQLRASREPGGIGAASRRYENECSSVWSSVTEALTTHDLAGVSPVVVDQFQQAVGAQHRNQPAAVLEHADSFAAAACRLEPPLPR